MNIIEFPVAGTKECEIEQRVIGTVTLAVTEDGASVFYADLSDEFYSHFAESLQALESAWRTAEEEIASPQAG